MTRLFVVESPGKLTTLKGILGTGWRVEASKGHITELANDGEDNLGFDVTERTITCRFVPRGDRGGERIRSLTQAARGVQEVYLATDPDREGEGIAQHLMEQLHLDPKIVRRVTFTQITEAAVREALAHPRRIDEHLVAAQRARQVLDKLVGYKVSPLVRRGSGGRSAGRVQSAALHLLCEREKEIQGFVPVDYWSVWVRYGEGFVAYFNGDKSTQEVAQAEGSLGDSDDPQLAREVESTRVLSLSEAERLVAIARTNVHSVESIRRQESTKSPPPPFITSSLQMVAGGRFSFSPERTMRLAQDLYEGVELPDGSSKGLITYMRTDSTVLAPEFVVGVREWLSEFDPNNLPTKSTAHRNHKGAQEAHEAIRPTDVRLTPEGLAGSLSADHLALYTLIWNRAVASQCAPARLDRTVIVTRSGSVQWLARGAVLVFSGYTRYWNDLAADAVLPQLAEGQTLHHLEAKHDQKRTQPPVRYSTPKLVALMEKRGIGRPSTYAPTIEVLQERGYAEVQKDKKLHVTDLGIRTDDLLERSLPELISSDFTAKMEAQLDEVALGRLEWQSYVISFKYGYLDPALGKLSERLPQSAEIPATRVLEQSAESCPQCEAMLSKVPSSRTKKGYFLKCEPCQLAGRGEVLRFWSDWRKQWEAPRPRDEATTEGAKLPANPVPQLTAYPCPVCKTKACLEIYSYSRDGETKRLLRCADTRARARADHKKVAYFWTSRGNWWNPDLKVTIDVDTPPAPTGTPGIPPDSSTASQDGGNKGNGSNKGNRPIQRRR